CPIEGPPREGTVLHLNALNKTAQNQSLAESGNRRPSRKRKSPVALARQRNPAELERDPTKYQRQQHDNHRQIKGRQDDRIGQRKRDHHSGATEDKPGFVAIPEWRDRIHHLVTFAVRRSEWKQDSDAQIEAVEDDVHRHRESDYSGPDNRQVCFHDATSLDDFSCHGAYYRAPARTS